MKKLTQQAFQTARSYILEQGRELDKRRFEFHFEDGTIETTLKALASYQNDDGGFGNSLEPDIRTPHTSVITSTGGFQILREIGATETHSIVQKGIQFFIDSYDPSLQAWHIIPPEVEDAPHAPWWNYENSRDCFGQFLINPRVEILGYLHEYRGLVPNDFLENITNTVFKHIQTLPDELEMHDAQCFLRLAETDDISDKDMIWDKITKGTTHIIARTPEQLNDYVLKPLWLVTNPSSRLYTPLKKEVNMNLDFEIEQQGEDGSWSPAFSWGDLHPEVWEVVKKEWQSKFTVETLITLKDFGRIEQ